MIRRPWLFALSFLAFPPAGLLARAVAGPVDDLVSGLVAGAVVGAVVGLAQWLALRAVLPRTVGLLWVPVTAAASAVGLAAVSAAGLSTTDRSDLLVIGAVVGVLVGLAQSRLLPPAFRRMWALVVPVAWTLAWQVTAAVGVDLTQGWAVFGASGALSFSVVLAGVLGVVGRRPSASPAEVAA